MTSISANNIGWKIYIDWALLMIFLCLMFFFRFRTSSIEHLTFFETLQLLL